MRAVVLYFLSLFFLLIGGMDGTHASVQQRQIYHAPVDKNVQLTVTSSQPVAVITKNLDIKKSGEEVTCVEDDDVDFVFARKQVPLAKCLTIHSYTTAFRYGGNYSGNRSSLYTYATFSISPKYITQRVLKI